MSKEQFFNIPGQQVADQEQEHRFGEMVRHVETDRAYSLLKRGLQQAVSEMDDGEDKLKLMRLLNVAENTKARVFFQRPRARVAELMIIENESQRAEGTPVATYKLLEATSGSSEEFPETVLVVRA